MLVGHTTEREETMIDAALAEAITKELADHPDPKSASELAWELACKDPSPEAAELAKQALKLESYSEVLNAMANAMAAEAGEDTHPISTALRLFAGQLARLEAAMM